MVFAPALKDPRLPKLTPAALRVLVWLRDNADDDDLVCEGIHCWYGESRTTWRVVSQLLDNVLISPDQFSDRERGPRHFNINGSGKRYLQNLPPYTDGDGRQFWTFYELYDAAKQSSDGLTHA